MHLPVLAFFSRAIRTETRSLMTYGIRTFLVGVLALTLLGSQAAAFTSNAPGLAFLGSLIVANLAIVSLVGLAYFSSAITEEKEEMTLGLLRMAGLSPVSILLGKSTSRLLFALMLLLVQVPFAFLAVTLGGVAIPQVLAAYTLVLAYTIFLCNTALLCSVLCQRSRSAAALTFVILLIFGLLPVLLDALQEIPSLRRMPDDAHLIVVMDAVGFGLAAVHPFARIGEIFGTGYSGGVWSTQVLASLVWSLVFFSLGWLLFNVRTRNQHVPSPSRGFLPQRTAMLRHLGAGRAWADALRWKDFYFVAGGKGKVLAKALVFATVLFLFALTVYAVQAYSMGGSPDLEEVRLIVAVTGWWTIFVISLVELAGYASRIFKTEVQWKTLPSLAGLPHTMGHVAWRKVLGCLPAMIPNLVFLLFCLLLMPETIGELLGEVLDEPSAWAGLFYAIAQFFLFLNLTAFLSLCVKWGALPIALVVHFMVHNVALSFVFRIPMLMAAGSMDPWSFLLIGGLVTAGLGVLFARLTVVRLERVAGELA